MEKACALFHRVHDFKNLNLLRSTSTQEKFNKGGAYCKHWVLSFLL